MRPEPLGERGLHPHVDVELPPGSVGGELLRHGGADDIDNPPTQHRVDRAVAPGVNLQAQRWMASGMEVGSNNIVRDR